MAEDDKKKPAADKAKGTKKKAGGGASPLAGLLARLKPKGGKASQAKGGPDPLENSALMAQIASEVASLDLPDRVTEDEAAQAAAATAASASAAPAPIAEEDATNYQMPTDPLDGDGRDLSMDGSLSDEDDLFPIRDEVDEAAEAYRARQRRNRLIAAAASGVLLLGVSGGLWALFSGDEDAARGGLAALEGQNHEGGVPLQVLQSGPTVSGLIPPLPGDAAAEGGALGTERSAGRRPWLDGGEGVINPAPTDDTAQAPVDPMTEPHVEPARDAQEPAQMAVLPVQPATSSLPQGSGPLPTLQEPQAPDLPGVGGKVPTFTTLASYATPGADALPAAPLDTLLRQTPAGMLPVRGPDGMAAWQAYAGPLYGPADRPRVTLIVAGLGLDLEATDAAISKLPASVTLAFSPYAPNLTVLMAQARAKGHEVLLELPLEAEGYPAEDPGPLGLMTTLPPAENLQRLERLLGTASGYTGVLARGGGRFTQTADQMRIVLQALGERGLLYVHPENAMTPPGTEGLDIRTATATLAVDARPFRGAIDARLGYLSDVARARGISVGVARPLPVTFDRLGLWARDLERGGVLLAPASSTVDAG